MSDPQKDRVLQAFTTQADCYANSAVVAAAEARRGFVAFVGPQAGDCVLDVATGPGFLALLFAERTAEVVGIDLTPAMLTRAEANRQARQIHNLRFEAGDAESLAFPDQSFDLATCGSAFHHLSDPARVLAQMVRVVRPGGRVALIDIITSEIPERAALHNQLEQWRDPSHTRALPVSELIALFGRAGLRDLRAATYITPRELSEWFAISHTPPDVADKVRAGFVASMVNDATGLGVHYEGERIRFDHTFAWVVGTRP